MLARLTRGKFVESNIQKTKKKGGKDDTEPAPFGSMVAVKKLGGSGTRGNGWRGKRRHVKPVYSGKYKRIIPSVSA